MIDGGLMRSDILLIKCTNYCNCSNIFWWRWVKAKFVAYDAITLYKTKGELEKLPRNIISAGADGVPRSHVCTLTTLN